MIIDFPNMETAVLKNFKGGEKEMLSRAFDDGTHKIMFNTLDPGASIGFHKHEGSDEVIYILEGEGTEIYEGNENRVYPGQCLYCPKEESHSLVNDGDAPLVFFAVVTNY